MRQNRLRLSEGTFFNLAVFLLLFAILHKSFSGQYVNTSGFSISVGYHYAYNTMATQLNYLGTVIIWFLMFSNLRKTSMRLFIVFMLDFFVFCFWMGMEYGTQSILTSLFGNPATSLCILPLCISLGFSDSVWKAANRSVKVVAFALLIATWLAMLQLIMQWGFFNFTGGVPGKELYSALIFVTWFYIASDKKTKVGFQYLFCISLIILAIIIKSRSWVIQSLFLAVVLLFKGGGGKKINKTFMAIALSVILILLITYVFPDAFDALMLRIDNDSRSGQYVQFFRQVSGTDLLWGKGTNASYSFGKITQYKYIDNQVLFWAFHYGMIPIFSFIYLLFRSICVNRFDRELDIYRMAVLSFLIAMIGLSIYCNLAFNIQSIYISLVIGRLLSKKPVKV